MIIMIGGGLLSRRRVVVALFGVHLQERTIGESFVAEVTGHDRASRVR